MKTGIWTWVPGAGQRPGAGRPTVLVVDDEPSVLETLADTVTRLGYRVVTAVSGEDALVAADRHRPDLVLTDVHMVAMSGVELCTRLKADPRFQLTPVVILTGVSDLDARVAGLAAGADDFFEKPVEMLELQTRLDALIRVKVLLDQLERAEAVITLLGQTVEARDPCTHGHCERLGRYAMAVGRAFGADAALLRALGLGGYLHDLGKIAVPDAILLKPGPLTVPERTVIQTHPGVGAHLVQGLRSLEDVRPIIRHHHERMDGSGYPDGLRGEAIPLGARITAVADVYDALRSARPYKGPFSRGQAVAIVRQETDRGWWDPRVVSAFLDLVNELDPAGA